MIQDNVSMCPRCSGALRKIYTDNDIVYVCVDKNCRTVLRVTGRGQSQRELECEVVQ